MRLSVIVFFLFAVVIAVPAAGKKVLAHYMPWFAAKPVSSAWGYHWTLNHFNPEVISNGLRQIAAHDYPSIGPYDSSDPVVLEYHVALMKLAGIDGVIVDWYGSQGYYDYPFNNTNTMRLFEATQRAGLDFSICYEDYTIQNLINGGKITASQATTCAKQDVLQLQQRYFTNALYLRHDNKPTLFTFGPQYFTSNASWSNIFSVLTTNPCFVALDNLHSLALANGAFAWPPMWMVPSTGVLSTTQLNSYLTDFEHAGAGWGILGAMAIPEFNDMYAEAGVSAGYGQLYPYSGQTFSNTLTRALTNTSDVIQIATWNDFSEGTCIEPTIQLGCQYLGIMQALRRQYLDASFSCTTNDLALARRLYDLRKQSTGNAAAQAELDLAFAAIVSYQLPNAASILDAVAQGQSNALRNVGFESRSASDNTLPQGWTRIQQALWTGTPNTHSGTGAVVCSGSGNWGSLRQTFYNTSLTGRTVTVSVWGMIPATAVISSGWNGAVLTLEETGGTTLATTNFINASSAKGIWIKGTVSAPVNVASVDVVLQAASSPTGAYFQGQVYFDDAELAVAIPEAGLGIGLLMGLAAAQRRRA